MIRLLSILSLTFSLHAVAGELDNEAGMTNQGLQGTIVIRVDQRNKSVSYIESEEALSSEKEAKALVKGGDFEKLPASQLVKELDREAGASSWYYYYVPHNNYYNNCLNYYGYNYYPYYSYNHGYYNYYYYGWHNRWW